MRNKLQIGSSLASRLNSSTWQELKKAMIGRELIAFGTEVIYSTEEVKESLNDALFLENADINGTISAASALEVSLQKIKPASVKLIIDESYNRYYSPFTLKFSIGSIVFTNIDYVKSGTIIELFQGNVSSSFSNNAQTTVDFMNLRVDSTKAWTEYTQYTKSKYFSKYLKLGQNVMDSSVRVLSKEGTLIKPVALFNPVMANNKIIMYKTRMGWDKSVNLIFGNELWGAPLDYTGTNYQVIWLDLTTADFDPENGALTYTPLGTTTSEVVDFVLHSYTTSADSDLEWMKYKVRSENAKYSILANREQIRNYVNTSQSVIDSSVVPSKFINLINVYVKPKVDTDTKFQDIEDGLTLFGELTTKYKVRQGSPFLFEILLSTPEVIDAGTKAAIIGYLETVYSYENTPYNKQINTNEIASLVKTLTDKVVVVGLRVSETIKEDNKVTFIPKPGTLELVINNTVVGWDAGGLIYSRKIAPSQVFLDVIGIGDFILVVTKNNLGETTGSTIINPANLLSVDTSDAIISSSSIEFQYTQSSISLSLGGLNFESLNSIITKNYNSTKINSPLLGKEYGRFSRNLTLHSTEEYIGYVIQLLFSANGIPSKRYKVVVYNNDASFEDGDYSIQKYNTAHKPAISNSLIDVSEVPFFDPRNIIVIGKDLYNVSITGTLFIVQKFYYTDQWIQVYYDIQANVVDGLKIVGMIEVENDLYIITNQTGSHFILENYKEEPVLYKNLSLVGNTGMPENQVIVSEKQSSVKRIGNKVLWNTFGYPAISVDDYTRELSFIELFDSETLQASNTITETIGISNFSKIRIRVFSAATPFSAISITPTFKIGGVTQTLATHFTVTYFTDELYPNDSFITLVPIVPAGTAVIGELILAVSSSITSITSNLVLNITMTDTASVYQKMFLTGLPTFNKFSNSIVLGSLPVEVLTDLDIHSSALSTPLSYKEGILSVRTKTVQSDLKNSIVKYDVTGNATLYFLEDGEYITSDGATKLNTVEQIGTIDYMSGILALLTTLNYKVRYKIQGAGDSIDQANYPKLESASWE